MPTGRWVEARWLRLGDRFLTRTGVSATVSELTIRLERVRVYNLHVESLQLYAVGQDGVLVHNSVTVTRWGHPGLRSGDWVMKGGNNWWNYFWSGKWQPRWFPGKNLPAPKGTGETFRVPADNVTWPKRWGIDGWIKGLCGQRRYWECVTMWSDAVRWVLSIGLGAIGLWIIVLNAYAIIASSAIRHRHVSWIPLIGGSALCLAVIAVPSPGAWRWWWLPFFVDCGCVPGLFLTLIWYVLRGRRIKP